MSDKPESDADLILARLAINDEADRAALATCRAISNAAKQPPRGPLSPEVEEAAHRVHGYIFGVPYKPGGGPLHHAGGSYWHDELLRRADHWERLAADARTCAQVLPDE